MAASYLALAIVLAVTLNQASRPMRVSGTLLAALALALIAASTVVADFDGTFVQLPSGLSAVERLTPAVLNVQAAVATALIGFLVWAAWRQAWRVVAGRLALGNTAAAFGWVSRLGHWGAATLVLCQIPLGMYVAVLPPGSADRGDFVATHQSLGVTVLGLVVLRLAWLVWSPAPSLPQDLPAWQRWGARAVHTGLYGLVVAFAGSGLIMTAYRGDALDVFGWSVAMPVGVATESATGWKTLHDRILPVVLQAVILVHVGAVVKHHFLDRRWDDVRRMLR
jgi:cytochrome b561